MIMPGFPLRPLRPLRETRFASRQGRQGRKVRLLFHPLTGLLAYSLTVFVLTSCARYRHERRPDGTEVTTYTSFLHIGSANNIRSQVRETNYSRLITVGNLQGKPDNDAFEAIATGAARGAVQGMKP